MAQHTPTNGLLSLVDGTPYTSIQLTVDDDFIDGVLYENAGTNSWAADTSVGIDLGQDRDVDYLILYGDTASDTPVSWNIARTLNVYSSQDNLNWTFVEAFTNPDLIHTGVTEWAAMLRFATLTRARYFKATAITNMTFDVDPPGVESARGGEIEAYVNDQIAATLPAWTAALGSGAVISTTLPSWDADLGALGASYKIDAVLPAWTSDIKTGGVLKATLPSWSASLTGRTGIVGSINLTLPSWSAILETGGLTSAIMPSWGASLTMTTGLIASLTATMPRWTASLAGTVSIIGEITASIPGWRANATTLTGIAAQIVQTMPRWTAALNADSGIVAQITAAMPAWTAALIGNQDPNAEIIVTMPSWIMDADGTLNARFVAYILRHTRP